MPNNTITYYEYDSHGRLLRAKLKENTSTGSVLLNTENKFDNLGRAVKSVYDLQKLGEKMTYTVTYKGNADIQSGRIASFTLPSNHSISYNYDAFERLTQKQLFIGTGAIPTEKFEYYTANNKTVNLVTSHTINVNNTMSNPQSQVVYNYTYDDYGNILTVKEGSTLKLSYVYDELNQLTRENNAYANKTYVYTYDKNGNILTKKTYAYTTGTLGTVQSTVNYTYGNSSWKDLLTNYNGTSISYDGVGNPTNWRGSITSLTWNGRQLNTLRNGSNTYTYTYNADGIRTQKALVYDGISMTSFTHYILDGTKVVAQYQTSTSSVTPSNVIYFYYDESGSPTGMKYNGNVYFFQKNLQGDIIRILNTQGSIVATYTYDAWGNIIASTDTSGVSIGTKNPFRYRGYYYDTETGLYYLNSRYYDPQVGRFLNADARLNTSLGILGINQFSYCLSNPVNMVDYCGNKPGDLFDTMDEAARDAAIYLGVLSFENGWEYATVIYTTTETVITYETVTKQHKFLWWTWTTTKTVKNRTKVTKYTYKAVKTDKKPDSVTIPRAPWFKKAVATLHTHPMGSGIGITQFSNYYDFFKDEWIGDIPNAKKRGIPSYVHGPNGELRKYDPVTGEDILLFGDLPKSPYLSTFTKGAK